MPLHAVMPRMTPMLPERLHTLLSAYPALTPLAETLSTLPMHQVPGQTVLFREQDDCPGFPLIVAGEVRVVRGNNQGRELELYRVRAGDLCLVSAASLFSGQRLSARGLTAHPTELIVLPPAAFRQALAHEAFRDFVLGLFAERMADLTALIESVAFQRLDRRLASALLGHGPQIHATHQALADELGTVREMVTRLLHRFERDGWVQLSRECITIQDSSALRAWASGDADHPPRTL